MSFDQIRYFVSVADEGSVTRAAGRLRVAQPAVSRQIRHLEDELGTRLFLRTPKGIRLSDSGATFLGHARAILSEIDTARRSVQSAEERVEAPAGMAVRRQPPG